MFYVSPDKTSGTAMKGEKIGTMMSMQSVYPEITSHVHIQLCDKSDITPYFWAAPEGPLQAHFWEADFCNILLMQ